MIKYIKWLLVACLTLITLPACDKKDEPTGKDYLDGKTFAAYFGDRDYGPNFKEMALSFQGDKFKFVDVDKRFQEPNGILELVEHTTELITGTYLYDGKGTVTLIPAEGSEYDHLKRTTQNKTSEDLKEIKLPVNEKSGYISLTGIDTGVEYRLIYQRRK